MEIFDAPLEKIEEDKENPRLDYGEEAEEILLGESLRTHQDYPIIVRPGTLAGWFILVDGHRRNRAARRVGLKTLKAMLVNKSLTPEEIRLIQLRTDLHKKHLTPFERSMIAVAIKKANPGLTVKQVAGLIHTEESLFWKYIQAEKLSPESLQAYKEGKIVLTVMVEVAKLSHEEQPILLNLKGSREEVAQARKRRKQEDVAVIRASKIKLELGNSLVVTIAGNDLSLDDAIEAAKAAQREMVKGRDLGLDAKTIVSVARDKARNGAA